MYKSFFGLRENPFNANPDPRYLFLTREIQEALAGLAYGIKNRKGFILLTGEVGTGKTTLLNRLLDWLNLEGVATAYIFNSQLDINQLFDFMMADFGIPCESRDKSHVLMRLNHWLLQRYRDRKTAADRAVRAAGAGGKAARPPTPAVASAHHHALQNAAAVSR